MRSAGTLTDVCPINTEPRYSEEFAAICQDEVYGAVLVEDNGNDE